MKKNILIFAFGAVTGVIGGYVCRKLQELQMLPDPLFKEEDFA